MALQMKTILRPFAIFLSHFTICLICSFPISAQTCGLRIGAYFDPDRSDPFFGISSLHGAPKGLIKGISATAIDRKTKVRLVSVELNGLRFFGDLDEGDYRVTVDKTGYKKTLYGVKLSCNESYQNLVTKYVRLGQDFKGQIVDHSKLPANELRSDRFVISDSSSTVGVKSKATPRTISGGVLNSSSTFLPTPTYPVAARVVRASGTISVKVLIDEKGRVVSATTTEGHPLLVPAAIEAAKNARFSPTLIDGVPVKVSGVLTYNFVL